MLSHNSSNKPIPKNPKEFFIANKNSNLTDILELLMSDSLVVVNDSYSLGLKILNNLKKILKKSIHSIIIQIKDSIVNTIDLNHIIYF